MNTRLANYTDNESNRKKLLEFYRFVYPDSPWLFDEERFVWQNLANPLQQDNEHAIWLLYDDNGDIIGQNIYIFYNLTIDSKSYRGFCSTNLIVKPGIVGKGFGHKMIEKNESLPGVAYAVGITPASTRAFVKRGWVYITDGKMMSRIINPTPNLKYLKKPGWKVMILSPMLKIANLLHGMLGMFRPVKDVDGVTHREISTFQPEWDKCWEDCLKDYAIHFSRLSDTLNYKYFSRNEVKHHVLLFEKDGQPVGYAVYRLSVNKARKIRLGRIVDIVFDPVYGSALAKQMIKVLKRKLLQDDIDGLVAVAATDEIAKCYRQNGLYLSRMQPAIIKEEDFTVEELREKYKHLWYITLGDSDLDNYW